VVRTIAFPLLSARGGRSPWRQRDHQSSVLEPHCWRWIGARSIPEICIGRTGRGRLASSAGASFHAIPSVRSSRRRRMHSWQSTRPPWAPADHSCVAEVIASSAAPGRAKHSPAPPPAGASWCVEAKVAALAPAGSGLVPARDCRSQGRPPSRRSQLLLSASCLQRSGFPASDPHCPARGDLQDRRPRTGRDLLRCRREDPEDRRYQVGRIWISRACRPSTAEWADRPVTGRRNEDHARARRSPHRAAVRC
jgi:hypothetical protein